MSAFLLPLLTFPFLSILLTYMIGKWCNVSLLILKRSCVRMSPNELNVRQKCSPIPSPIAHCKESVVFLVVSLFLTAVCDSSVVGAAVEVDIKEVGT